MPSVLPVPHRQLLQLLEPFLGLQERLQGIDLVLQRFFVALKVFLELGVHLLERVLELARI